jgi:hypothetical protein
VALQLRVVVVRLEVVLTVGLSEVNRVVSVFSAKVVSRPHRLIASIQPPQFISPKLHISSNIHHFHSNSSTSPSINHPSIQLQVSIMVLKRKRSDSEISTSSSLLSSPLSSAGYMSMDGFQSHQPQIATPTLFASRTRKRHRDNRPSESDVHRMNLSCQL